MQIGETIEGRTLYTRIVAGTEWPCFYQIRQQGKCKYSVTEIFNGIGQSYREFDSLKKAKEFAL